MREATCYLVACIKVNGTESKNLGQNSTEKHAQSMTSIPSLSLNANAILTLVHNGHKNQQGPKRQKESCRDAGLVLAKTK